MPARSKAGAAPQLRRGLTLRVAVVWGTNVLSTELLRPGESYTVGGRLIRPEGSALPDQLLTATAQGWSLDCRGCKGGALYVAGREEDPGHRARDGGKVPVAPGDHGLLQYERIGIFFQVGSAGPPLEGRIAVEWSLVGAALLSLVSVLGFLSLNYAITVPRSLGLPLALMSEGELQHTLLRPDRRPPILAGIQPGQSPGYREAWDDATPQRREPDASAGSSAIEPRIKVEPGSAVTEAQWRQALRPQASALRHCLEPVAPKLHLVLNVRVAVSKDGAVSVDLLSSSSPLQKGTEACLVGALRSLRFGTSERPSSAVLTLAGPADGPSPNAPDRH